MSNDNFTETTTTGYFSRIGSSVMGRLVGLGCLLISVVLLWWNEGRSIKTANGLAEGAKVTVEADSAKVDAAKAGQLVHVVGKTTLKGPAQDDLFGVTGPDVIKLHRLAELFQWVEKKSTKTEKHVGGSETTVTEYHYEKKWESGMNDSSSFKHQGGHENVKSNIETAEFNASEVSLGAYRLPGFLLAQWNDFKPEPLPDPKALTGTLHDIASVDGKWLVLSATPKAPVVGDVRVQFGAIKAGDTSVLARQVEDTFEEYTTTQGTDIGRITSGVQSKEAMFAAAAAENTFIAWLLRFIGFVLMFVGFASLLKPLKVLADVLPFLGSIVGAGTGFVAFLISAVGSVTIIALAWLWYRPMLGIALLALAGGGIILLRQKASAAKAAGASPK